MPKLKLEDDELDVDELEEAEYTEGEFESYDGEIPPKGTRLIGYVKSIWYTRTKNDDAMLKVLFVADGNTGAEEEYNGLPIFENAALIPGAKFRWAPMMKVFGITLRDVKNKMVAESTEDDQFGAKLKSIGSLVPGSDESWFTVQTGRERYDGAWQARAAKWFPYEDPEDTVEPEDEEEDTEVEVEEVEDEDVAEEPEDEEDTPEEEPAPPARGRRAAATKTAAKSDTKKPAAKAAAPARGARTASSGRTAKPAAKAAAPARGRRSAAAAVEDDEPPF